MKIIKYIFLALLPLFVASCSKHSSPLTYFTDIETLGDVQLGDYSVKIEPSDELLINVSAMNPEAVAAYNLMLVNNVTRGTTSAQTVPEQQTYTVDPEGYITFPKLGRIHVAGMTVDQLRDYLTQRIAADVSDPIVTVTLVGFMVSIGGEVIRPGRIHVTSPRFTLLDAISAAGDLTQYGKRDNVLLIREEDGVRKHIRLDLTSADVLASPYMYMKQNDYIYVEPNNVRQDNAEYNQYNAFKLSVVSTIVSGSASVISLIIALTR